ncbi:hypothetical protein VPH35_019480 [Triticum aestivum]
MTGRVGRRGKPSMAILVALLMASVALPLLMVPDMLSMPGSNGVDRGAALSLPRPCFSRSVRLENSREKRESWMEVLYFCCINIFSMSLLPPLCFWFGPKRHRLDSLRGSLAQTCPTWPSEIEASHR